ncbi:MAG: DNA polymerase, partial [Acutalibacteraceae bacterium]|nr:DNA polymerase [Acutalibacteraceae bacterium]
YLKEGMLPFIQIKGNWLYKGTECLETSDIKDPKTGEYHRYYRDIHGEVKEAKVTLTLTCTDFKLFLEHYNIRDFKILDGCWFKARIGLFDDYINPYKQLKIKSKGAMRELAKLFLNNLYGKMASNDDSSFKVAYLKDDNSLGFMPCEAHDKKAGYIPIGSAITSYARNFTIRAAQKNYYGADKAGFIYADTDSIHCDIPPEKVKGITVDPVNFCCWKLESYWDEAIFVRQKTYIEHITHEDGEPIDKPYYNVKCAGMPEKCKDLFVKSMTGYEVKEGDKYDEEEKEFINTKRSLKDFKVGLKIKGKLMPKRIHGGTVLVEGYYEMRKI